VKRTVETGYKSRMKRKIALLLAFTMILSTLPLSVAGNWWGTGNRTGTMWEQTGPTANLRHWGDGVLVTSDLPGRAAQFTGSTNRNLAPAPGGVHRHIGVALDYFRGRENVSSTAIRVDINNAYTWAVGHGAGVAGDRGYMSFTNSIAWNSNAPLLGRDLGDLLIAEQVWNPGWNWGSAPVGINQYRVLAEALAAGHNIQATQWEAYVQRLANAFANRAAYTAIVPAQGGSQGYFAVTLIPMGRRWAEMILVNLTPGVSGAIHANDATFIPVPIEYITEGGTNDNPVFLTFTQQTGWPEAGANNRRTDLTTVAQNRFNLSVGSMRHFHRYGRAAVEFVRIAEGAQGAFDHNHWYIQLDIITPGFAWARQSLNADVRSNHGASGIGIPSSWTNSSTYIVRAPRITDRSARETGHNDRYTLAVTMPGAVRDGRTVMDRLDIGNYLYIVANDRARDGDVTVELTMWRAAPSTDYVGQGRWEPSVIVATDHPLTALGVPLSHRLQVGTTVNLTDAQMERFTNSQRSVPAVPSPQHIVHVRQEGSTQVGTTWSIPSGIPSATWWEHYTASTAASFGFWSPDTRPGAAANARVPHYILNWNWVPAHMHYGAWGPVGDHVFRDTFTAARFGSLGLEFFVHEDHDVEDHWLRSGAMEWDIQAPAAGVLAHNRGYVVAGSPNPDYHRVVRTVLRETVPGSLPATGAHPTVFSFDEGIQILGARFWTNDADFIAEDNDISDAEVWFDGISAGDNYLNASITRNQLTIRPEIGDSGRRNTIAEIQIEFYVSVQPNFEDLFGAPIEVTVESGTVEAPFEETLVVAYAWDPITAATTVVTVDDGDIEAAFGLIRAVPVSNIVITEVEAGVLIAGTRLWVGVEGGISRGWGSADHISLGATHVTTNDPNLQLSPVRLDSHGAYVEVIRGSRYDGATITFHGVAVSGRVLSDTQYNIVVGGDAVAANWEEFAWVHGQGIGSLTRGSMHGFFADEPYQVPAFSFEGSDLALVGPPPVIQTPSGPQPPIGQTFGPVTFFTHSSHQLRDGDTVTAPVFMLVPNITNPGFMTSYVSARVVADVAGWPWGNGFSTFEGSTAIFSDGVNTIEFTDGSTTAVINGVPTPITAGGLGADARIVQGRMFVPISFFNLPNVPMPISVRWNPYVTAAERSITITPIG